MANKLISFNPAQLASVILNPINKIDIAGRGEGKSSLIAWDIDQINRYMPRSVTAITGKTFGQLLTRTLPSTFNFLEQQLGYVRDVHYVINRKPPDHFKTPYEKILKHEHFISFINGTGYLLLSQDRLGSARGPNVDYEIVDEALTINKERYDQEVSPTNRGNLDKWGTRSPNYVHFHHGFHYVSSMPFSAEGKWLLDYGKYYEDEAGIRIFDIWNRVVKMQLELLQIDNTKEFTAQWNEIARIRSQIKPFISKEGTLFLLSNAFDNIKNVGLSYIKREYEKQTNLTFMIEIMNWIPDKIEDCYYNLDPDLHIYYEAYNNGYLNDIAENNQWDFNKISKVHSRYDSDCNPDQPIELAIDWGSNISFLIACQENNFVLANRKKSFNYLKEFYTKPQKGRVMIDDIIDEFCNYYYYHNDKAVIYWRDKYGDEKQANSSKTYNEQAIDRLRANGWDVIIQLYKAKEPPHHEKYLFWANILKENNEKYPIIRINGNNCKNLIIALNNTRVVENEGRFKKDKSSEKTESSTPQEQATHSTDAADKIVWYKYHNRLQISTFIPARLG